MRRLRALLATGLTAALAVLVLAGCAHGPDEEMIPRTTPTVTVTSVPAVPLPRLRTGSGEATPPAPGEVVWAHNGRVHQHGSVVDVSPLRIDRLVPARSGLFFLSHQELWSLRGGRATFTRYAGVHEIAASADGRYLGFVDRRHGAGDADGTRRATVLVFDTTDGRRVLRSTTDLGGPGQDLAELYAEHPPAVLGFTDVRGSPALVVRTPVGVRAYPVDGARVRDTEPPDRPGPRRLSLAATGDGFVPAAAGPHRMRVSGWVDGRAVGRVRLADGTGAGLWSCPAGRAAARPGGGAAADACRRVARQRELGGPGPIVVAMPGPRGG